MDPNYISSEEDEENTIDEYDYKKSIEKPVKLIFKLKKNLATNTISKVNKIITVSDDYYNNLEKTNSHTEAAIITTAAITSSKTVESASLVLATEVGTGIAAGGGYTPLAIVGGVLGAGVTYLSGLEAAEQTKQLVKNVTTNTLHIVKQIKNELPGYIKDIIYSCVSNPVEQALKFVYDLSVQSTNKIKQTVSEVLCKNWENLSPNSTIIYCEDLNQNKIEILLDKNISTKIFDYCRTGSNNNHLSPDYNYYSTVLNDLGMTKLPNQSFELEYKKFEEKFNSFQYQLENCNFTSQIAKKQTPYEQLALTLPRPNPIRHRIDPNTIPDYKVNVHVSGGSGGGGGMTAVGCVVAIAIKVSFLF